MIWLYIGISVLAAALYRAGGAAWGKSWLRDIGVSLCICLTLALLGLKLSLLAWLSLIPCFGLMWASISTYHYFLPKPKDYTALFYALHGFMVALAVFPFAWATGHWVGFGIRCVACAGAMYGWYYLAKWNDTIHEAGRGFILCISSLLFLI